MRRPPVPTPVFHITLGTNLPGIFREGCVWAKNAMLARQLPCELLSEASVQALRANRIVPCGPGGGIHDYVPFYFENRSPMLYSRVFHHEPEQRVRQDAIVTLRSSVQTLVGVGARFVLTNGNAAVKTSDVFDDLTRLDQVDWDLMRETWWKNTDADTDRKRRRAAEFLVWQRVELAWIEEIGVLTERAAARVIEIAGQAQCAQLPRVAVQPSWYY